MAISETSPRLLLILSLIFISGTAFAQYDENGVVNPEWEQQKMERLQNRNAVGGSARGHFLDKKQHPLSHEQLRPISKDISKACDGLDYNACKAAEIDALKAKKRQAQIKARIEDHPKTRQDYRAHPVQP